MKAITGFAVAVAALLLTGCGSPAEVKGDAKPTYSATIDPDEVSADGETRAEMIEGIRQLEANEGRYVPTHEEIEIIAADVCQRTFEKGAPEFKVIDDAWLAEARLAEDTDAYYVPRHLILRMAGIFDCTPSEIEAARAAEPTLKEPATDPGCLEPGACLD